MFLEQSPPKPPVFNPAAVKKKEEAPKLPPAQPVGVKKKVSSMVKKKFVPPVPPQVAAKMPPPEPEEYVWVAHIDVESGIVISKGAFGNVSLLSTK